jgi:hypothetical protein
MRREEEIGLIRKAKEGDTVAFAVMIRRYQNLVYATAFQILASRKEQRRLGALEEAGVLQSPSADAEQEVESERRDADAFGEASGRKTERRKGVT